MTLRQAPFAGDDPRGETDPIVKVTVRMPRSLYERVAALAAEQERSANGQVVQMLKDGCATAEAEAERKRRRTG